MDREEAGQEHLDDGPWMPSQGVWKLSGRPWGAVEGFWFWRSPLAACRGFAEKARLKEETVQSGEWGVQPARGSGGADLWGEGRDLGGEMDRSLRGTMG